MADQIFNVTCGFFDSINKDRLYSADQMTMPYKRIVADGVFATQEGTPSTDLQVIAGTGMGIVVKAGNGIFGEKWFESASSIAITVPANTAIQARIDSVIAQVDKRSSGRTGSIVYRTGTASVNPAAPDLSDDEDVVEYRIANVYVSPGASEISQGDITDLRGSASCPWVTSLIQQVDTSTLWNQYSSAFADLYAQYTRDYDEYTEQQKAAWDAFIQTLTDELSVSTNVLMLTNVYTSTAEVSTINIGIPFYDKTTDILQVYINGLIAIKGTDYTEGNGTITLAVPLLAGQTVFFCAMKSVISASIESAVSMIQRIDRKIDSFMSDSGWQTMEMEHGTAGTIAPAVRCIGNRVYMRGVFSGITDLNSNICTVPVSMRPAVDHVFTSCSVASGVVNEDVTITVSASTGALTITAKSDTLTGTDTILLTTCYLANAGNSVWSVYEYKGAVSTFYDLPVDNKAGDCYMVLAASPQNGVSAGDTVMWNGASWEVLESVIPSYQIDAIISDVS